MKKILLSAAAFAVVAVSAVSIAPTTSEAIPAFARQTGAACLSCHFQTFPAVNAFGRSFKLGGFTDVGEQALIEDDHLSIPSALNATFVLRAQYESVNAAGVTTANYNIPADAVLMIGGRVAETFGAFLEVDLQGGGAVNWQLMNSNDLGSFKAGLNIYNAGFGPTGAIEISNVFGQHGGKLNGKALSATETLFQLPTGGGALDGNTTSVALWAGNEMGLIQLAAVAPSNGAKASVDPRFATLVRAVFTPELAGMNGLIGFGVMTGTTGVAASGTSRVSSYFVDAQLQGDIGDTSLGLYADYASSKTADALTLITPTALLATASTGYSLRAEVKPLHNVMLALGYGKTTIAGVDTTQTQVAATYELYQNVEINAFYNSSRKAGATTNTKFVEIEALM